MLQGAGNRKKKAPRLHGTPFRSNDELIADLVSAAGELTASAAATAATAKTATTGAIFTGLGFIDGQSATIQIMAIELGCGLVGLILCAHFHESEPAGLVGELVRDQVAGGDGSGLFEQFQNVAFGGVE